MRSGSCAWGGEPNRSRMAKSCCNSTSARSRCRPRRRCPGQSPWSVDLDIVVVVLWMVSSRTTAMAMTLPHPPTTTHHWGDIVPRVEPQLETTMKAMALWRTTTTAAAAALFTVAAVLGTATPLATAASETYNNWQLGNGAVSLQETTVVEDLRLTDPVLLGSGGGGAVFAMKNKSPGSGRGTMTDQDKVALKVSWIKSASSVRNECQILQRLEGASRAMASGTSARSTTLEQCLGTAPYPPDPQNRVMIALRPVFDDDAAESIAALETVPLQERAIRDCLHMMIQTLSAGVVTADVQPLISQRTGRVLVIDWTEARVLNYISTTSSSSSTMDNNGPTATATSLSLNDADAAALVSFVNECLALIPIEWQDSKYVSDVLRDELRHHPPLPRTVREVLQGQNWNDEAERALADD